MTLYHALYVQQGAGFVQRFPAYHPTTGAALDVSTWAVACQVRASRESNAALLATLAPTANSAGYFELLIPGATSAAWNWRVGYYDLVVTEPGQQPDRWAQGPVYVDPRVSV